MPDEISRIRETLRSFSDQGCGLILATGGTGIAERDVTPEAIRGMMRVELPGFGETMRRESMKITPECNSIPQPGCCGGTLARSRASRQTIRRGGMPWVCGRRHSACGRPGPTRADIVLKLAGRRSAEPWALTGQARSKRLRNDEARMTKDEGMTKLEIRNQSRAVPSSFVLRQSKRSRMTKDEGMTKPEIRSESRAVPSSFVLRQSKRSRMTKLE